MAGKRARRSNHPKKQYVKKEPFSFKKLSPEMKKKYALLGGAAAVLVVLLILLAVFDMYPHFSGSEHVRFGKIVGAEEDWLIGESDGSYYKLGEYADPLEGYTYGDLTQCDKGGVKSVYAYPEDKESGVSYYYLCGVAKEAEEMLDTYLTSVDGYITDAHTMTQALRGTTNAGDEFVYCVMNFTAPGSYSGKYEKTLTGYVPKNDRCCTLISIAGKYDSQEEMASDEEFTKLFIQIADTIAFEK